MELRSRTAVALAVAATTVACGAITAPAANACGTIVSALKQYDTTVRFSGSNTCPHFAETQHIQKQGAFGIWITVASATWPLNVVSFSMSHSVCRTGGGNYRSLAMINGRPWYGNPIGVSYPRSCL